MVASLHLDKVNNSVSSIGSSCIGCGDNGDFYGGADGGADGVLDGGINCSVNSLVNGGANGGVNSDSRVSDVLFKDGVNSDSSSGTQRKCQQLR